MPEMRQSGIRMSLVYFKMHHCGYPFSLCAFYVAICPSTTSLGTGQVGRRGAAGFRKKPPQGLEKIVA